MLNQDRCWAAVIAHDATQDGHFFYSVRTTGVYCRPGCASRQPRRENVAFYESIAAAEAAGFRPCKRCRPNEGSQADRHIAAIGRACALIRDRDGLPSLAELADAAGISRFHFHRVFKQITGATPREWGKAHRLDLPARPSPIRRDGSPSGTPRPSRRACGAARRTACTAVRVRRRARA